MQRTVRSPEALTGEISVPGDKSISHRALILNSVAKGRAVVTGLSNGEDVLSTMGCMRAMGVDIQPSGQPGAVTVQGSGWDLEEPDDALDAGNSGTSMRLLSGILAGQPFLSVINGDASLRTRPMGRIVQPLQQMGASVMGRRNDTLAPLTIRGGSLNGIEYQLPVASAQVKSCIMLAALAAQGDTIIHQPALSRDHTERMVSAMGGTVVSDGLTLVVQPAELSSADIAVPGDISSAAFWLVAGLCHPQARILVKGIGLNPSRTGIIDALQAMGAGEGLKLLDQRVEGGEPVADLLVTPADLSGTEVGGDMIPRILDEVPVLAVAACFAEGDTIIRDAAELRVKESDRIATTVSELTKMGANIEAREDGMVIHGSGGLTGAACKSHRDHRLAMALGVAGLISRGTTTIDGAEDASISYPGFWEDLALLSGAGLGSG